MSGMIWNIIFGILTGIISGLYTGFVMAKYSAFCQIRFEIIYICRNFHISATNENIDSYSFTNYADIANAACNFFISSIKVLEMKLLSFIQILRIQC